MMWLCGLPCITNMVATAAVAAKPNIVILFVDGTAISTLYVVLYTDVLHVHSQSAGGPPLACICTYLYLSI